MTNTVVIAGAGPAGLTAALELLRHSDRKPIVFETDTQVGGISKTVKYRGNRMDLGGHRFFSKSDWVMNWWQEILPIQTNKAAEPLKLTFQQASRDLTPIAADTASDNVMLVRSRLSRIYYRRRFYDYPLRLNIASLRNLGLATTAAIGTSYARSRLFPRKPEETLEDFLINRFGNRLYRTFFKEYTEKVWGVECREISAEWGAQRIKGLSISKALAHALQSAFRKTRDIKQKDVETSLIEQFLYPKYGPGQMWEKVTEKVIAGGGEVHLNHRVTGLKRAGERISAVQVVDLKSGEQRQVACDAFISTMPIKDLVGMLEHRESEIKHIASALPYRDFMTAGLIVRRMQKTTQEKNEASNGMPPDNWIYIQESDVRLGRLQIFNNWSPALVADPATISLGLEYFCSEGDDLWSMQDTEFIDFAARELEKIGLVDRRDVIDGTIVRVPKAYPAYFGEYSHIGQVREFLDGIPNLYVVGRNGMHRYNNQDHSMLTAKAAVQCIISGSSSRRAIWSVNTEDDYHEERTS